jgi:hypothetical protein
MLYTPVRRIYVFLALGYLTRDNERQIAYLEWPPRLYRMSNNDRCNFRNVLRNSRARHNIRTFRHYITIVYVLNRRVDIWLHCSQENGNTSAKRQSMSRGLTEPNVWNGCNDAIGRIIEWIHLLRHPFMHFTDSCKRQVVCVNVKFPSQQNVWLELMCQLEVCRVTSVHTNHPYMIK